MGYHAPESGLEWLDTSSQFRYTWLMSSQLPSGCPGHRYCGRFFTRPEIEVIRQIIALPQEYPTRAAIAPAVCAALAWYKPDGLPKDMSARVALLRMEQDGLLTLPAATHSYTPSRGAVFTTASDPQPELRCPCPKTDIKLSRIATRADSHLWNELAARYHYLGYRPLPGAQIRYI